MTVLRLTYLGHLSPLTQRNIVLYAHHYLRSHHISDYTDSIGHLSELPTPHRFNLVFGAPLEFSLERDPVTVEGLKIPRLVHELCTEILKHIDFVGLFRISGNVQRVSAFIELANKGELYDLSEFKPPDLTSILKQYLRQLPVPVLSDSIMDAFSRALNIGSNINNNNILKIELCSMLCITMNPAIYNLLIYLLRFLSTIVSHEEINQMNNRNIATCICPTLASLKDEIKSISSNNCNEYLMSGKNTLQMHKTGNAGPGNNVSSSMSNKSDTDRINNERKSLFIFEELLSMSLDLGVITKAMQEQSLAYSQSVAKKEQGLQPSFASEDNSASISCHPGKVEKPEKRRSIVKEARKGSLPSHDGLYLKWDNSELNPTQVSEEQDKEVKLNRGNSFKRGISSIKRSNSLEKLKKGMSDLGETMKNLAGRKKT